MNTIRRLYAFLSQTPIQRVFKRIVFVCAISFFIWFSSFYILHSERSDGAGKIDFAVFYSAGHMMIDKEYSATSVYKRSELLSVINEFRKKDGASVFLYPPPAAVMFIPLSLLPFKSGAYIWACINSISILIAYYLTIAVLLRDHITRLRYSILLIGLAYTDTVHSLFFYGQINGVLLLLMIGGCIALAQHSHAPPSQKRKWLSGVLFGTAAVIKIFPVLFLPYLCIKKQWTAALSMALTGVGWFIIALPFFHFKGIWHFFTQRVPDFFSGDVGFLNESTSLFGSFRASVRQGRFDWLGLDMNNGQLINIGEKVLPFLCIVLICGAGYVLWKKREVYSGQQMLLDYGLILLVILLLPKSTHLAFHLWIIPITLYWIARIRIGARVSTVMLGVLMVFILFFTQIWKIPGYYTVYQTIVFLKPATAAIITLGVVLVREYFVADDKNLIS